MKFLMEYLKQISSNLYQMAKRSIAVSSEDDGPMYLKETIERDAIQLKHLAEAKDYRSMSESCGFFIFLRGA